MKLTIVIQIVRYVCVGDSRWCIAWTLRMLLKCDKSVLIGGVERCRRWFLKDVRMVAGK